MAAKSKNKYDVYHWIKDEVIPSCITIRQNVNCKKLIYNFKNTYNDYELSEILLNLSHKQLLNENV
jgi:hypothetical protein